MQDILTKNSAKSKTILTTLAILSAIILPQIFHALGAMSGLGTSLGSAFLPMHLPVFLAGLLGGTLVGLVAGIISPLLSFAISGMPTASMLPYMMVELAVYGAVCGLLKNKNMPVILKVLVAQVVGRVVRSLTIVFAVYVLNSSIAIQSAYSYLLTGLIGVLLQLILIPLIMYRLKAWQNPTENQD